MVDPNSLYIQIFEWTTEKDVLRAFKKIFEEKENSRFSHVSRVEAMARRIWLLTQEGLGDNEIISTLKTMMKEFGGGKVPNQGNVSNYRQRYKKALSSLRAFD